MILSRRNRYPVLRINSFGPVANTFPSAQQRLPVRSSWISTTTWPIGVILGRILLRFASTPREKLPIVHSYVDSLTVSISSCRYRNLVEQGVVPLSFRLPPSQQHRKCLQCLKVWYGAHQPSTFTSLLHQYSDHRTIYFGPSAKTFLCAGQQIPVRSLQKSTTTSPIDLL